MIKNKITKWLIDEKFIQKANDIRQLSHKQLVKKYQGCVKIKEHLESITSTSTM